MTSVTRCVSSGACLWLLAGVIWISATAFECLEGADGAGRPNVVLFLIDDLGWRDLGCQGSTYYRTPQIDELAETGIRYTQAYAACAVCSPTRAAILTGKAPARLLLTDWLPAGRWDPAARLREGRLVRGLPVEEETVAEVLRAAGYRTGSVGKWHLGSEPFSLPEHHGFMVNIGGNAHGAPGSYFHPYAGNWMIPGTGLRATWQVLQDGKSGEYLTDRLTDEAVRFIEDSGDNPFFLYVPHYGVHTPLEAKPELISRYQSVSESERQGLPEYAAMIESVDESVGRILQTLRKTGVDERTMIIFTSDNGGFWKATSNAPLRANKGAYYEGGIRVPLIIRWPGQQTGRVEEDPVISMDLYPAILSAVGLPLRPEQHLDGADLSLHQRGDKLPERNLYWHYPHYNEHPGSVPCSVIRSGRWKLIEMFDPAAVELYDLQADAGEQKNLADTEPAVCLRLLEQLTAWRTEADAELMRPNPGWDPAATNRRKKRGAKKNAAAD